MQHDERPFRVRMRNARSEDMLSETTPTADVGAASDEPLRGLSIKIILRIVGS